MAVSRLDAIPEDPGGCRDDHGRDDEREHGNVERCMKKEKRADGGANDQRDKDTAQSAGLFAGQGFTIGPIAGQEDNRSGGSSRKYAANVKLPDSGALVPIASAQTARRMGIRLSVAHLRQIGVAA